MGYDNSSYGNEGRSSMQNDSIYSKRIKAGKRRTYFFDVRATRGNDYFVTITESKRRADDSGYERHKIFLYKEDFNKFAAALVETIEYVKTDLMPDFDFDAFNHDGEGEEGAAYTQPAVAPVAVASPAVAEEITAAVTEAQILDIADTTVDAWKM